MQDIETWIR